jgi:DNA replication protein DnaC
MGYNKTAYEKAERELIRRRKEAETTARLRFDEVALLAPELIQIDNKMKANIMDLTKLLFVNKNETADRLEKIRIEHENGVSLKQKILKVNGLPEDYLDTRYKCAECQDTGFTDHTRCPCFVHLINAYAVEELNKYANLPECDFEHFSLSYYRGKTDAGYDIHKMMANNYKTALAYAEQFDLSSESLLIYGLTGLGKTHISLSIAKKVIEKGYTVAYNSVINYLNEISKEKYGRAEDPTADTEREIIGVDLLVIDDLGSEHNTSYLEAIIYNIINTRMNLHKPTIINCNLADFDELREIYDDRLVSRIAGFYKRIQFVGNDIRQQLRSAHRK